MIKLRDGSENGLAILKRVRVLKVALQSSKGNLICRWAHPAALNDSEPRTLPAIGRVPAAGRTAATTRRRSFRRQAFAPGRRRRRGGGRRASSSARARPWVRSFLKGRL